MVARPRVHREASECLDSLERLFENEQVLDVANCMPDGATAVDVPQLGPYPGARLGVQHGGRRGAPPLPVHPALAEVLPGGLRRGSTVAVSGSVSLLLAALGAASASGAWCALVRRFANSRV